MAWFQSRATHALSIQLGTAHYAIDPGCTVEIPDRMAYLVNLRKYPLEEVGSPARYELSNEEGLRLVEALSTTKADLLRENPHLFIAPPAPSAFQAPKTKKKAKTS